MEILIFSDAHGNSHAMREALSRQLTPPDAICFLGDGLRDAESLAMERGLLWTVRGNCDASPAFSDVPTERTVELYGHRLLLLHGHTRFVKSGYGALLSHARAVGADVVLFGHTHVPTLLTLEEEGRPLYLFNPGSIGYEGSFGTLHLTENAVLFSHGTLKN